MSDLEAENARLRAMMGQQQPPTVTNRAVMGGSPSVGQMPYINGNMLYMNASSPSNQLGNNHLGHGGHVGRPANNNHSEYRQMLNTQPAFTSPFRSGARRRMSPTSAAKIEASMLSQRQNMYHGHLSLRENSQQIANLTNRNNLQEEAFQGFLLEQSGIYDEEEHSDVMVDAPRVNNTNSNYLLNQLHPEGIDSLQDHLAEQKQCDAFAEAAAVSANNKSNSITSNGQKASLTAPTSYNYTKQDAASLAAFAQTLDADDDSSLGGTMTEEEGEHFAEIKQLVNNQERGWQDPAYCQEALLRRITRREFPEQESVPPAQWSCLKCTLENEPTATTCAACGTPMNHGKSNSKAISAETISASSVAGGGIFLQGAGGDVFSQGVAANVAEGHSNNNPGTTGAQPGVGVPFNLTGGGGNPFTSLRAANVAEGRSNNNPGTTGAQPGIGVPFNLTGGAGNPSTSLRKKKRRDPDIQGSDEGEKENEEPAVATGTKKKPVVATGKNEKPAVAAGTPSFKRRRMN